MNKTTILVVEDDTPVRNLITTTLKTHDYKYLTANDGASAIMEASSYNPDILLLDLGLPDMDGINVVKTVREFNERLPIIVVSARDGEDEKIKCLDAGVNDYVQKPFSSAELTARIRAALRYSAASEGMQTAIFSNGDLQIDFTAHSVYVRGEEVHLTNYEYKLLCVWAWDTE